MSHTLVTRSNISSKYSLNYFLFIHLLFEDISSNCFDFGHCIYILVDNGEYFTYSWLGTELMTEKLSIISILLFEIVWNFVHCMKTLLRILPPVSWYWSVAVVTPSQSPGACHVVNTGVMFRVWENCSQWDWTVECCHQSDRGDSEWCHNGVTIRLQRLSRVMSSSWQRWFVVTRRTLWSEIVTLELRQQLR